MKPAYVRLLPYAFKRFCILSARRTLLPTIEYYLTRTPLESSPKPALFTMNILPPMMTVWYHIVRKALGNRVDIVIFDSSGTLDPKEFKGAHIKRFLNRYAATKSDEFLYHIARNRRIGWICDDDMFPLSMKMLDVMEREFRDPKTASVSFRPRTWWHFDIDGTEYEPSSSYCTAFNREIFCGKEHLSLAPESGNMHPSTIGKPPGRYDTFDRANEILIQKGYRCSVIPESERRQYIAGFSGVSGAVMLLYYFSSPQQVMDYYESPPKKYWSGNMLFGTLQSMIAISIIQKLYTEIKGRPYPLPSLPLLQDLQRILNQHKQYLREDQVIEEVYEAGERLHKAI